MDSEDDRNFNDADIPVVAYTLMAWLPGELVVQQVENIMLAISELSCFYSFDGPDAGGNLLVTFRLPTANHVFGVTEARNALAEIIGRLA